MTEPINLTQLRADFTSNADELPYSEEVLALIDTTEAAIKVCLNALNDHVLQDARVQIPVMDELRQTLTPYTT